MRLRNKIIIGGAVLVFVSLIVLVSCRSYFIRAVRVPTSAMSNTIVPGDCLFVWRLSGDVQRGDIVVFAYPGEPSIRYISRVIGLPGETIQVQGTSVLINGQAIPEQHVFVKHPTDFDFDVLEELSSEGAGPYRVFFFSDRETFSATFSPDMKFGVAGPFQVPRDEYFMMSDFRDNSVDSRMKGTVPRNLIWGKPTFVYWSSHANQSHAEEVKWDRIGKEVK
jgi:signal peptidase I